MPYTSELTFLCEIFKKCRLHAFVATPDTFSKKIEQINEQSLFEREINARRFLHHFPTDLEPATLYKLTDKLNLCYLYLLLPDSKVERTVLFIGPYHTGTPTHEQMLELGEQNGISPQRQRYFEEYYTGFPTLQADSHLFTMLNTFCERIWKRPSFAIIDINQRDKIPVSPIDISMEEAPFDDVLVNMKAMEQRYAFENEIIRAVELGQLHKENRLFSSLSSQLFEKRTPDELRNAKNYSIIMNTLLRKAAERGGVHPLYLDRVSSRFALQIEQLSMLSKNTDLMCEMFRAYCRLVRKHSIKNFSPPVQKTILFIDSDLSANLSPNLLAERQGISLGYLSTIFKKETGKTISEYIREKRIKHAAHLLKTTHLQIQTVALHCGIMDVQYFSKIFKKETGKTPKEYRENS